MIDLHTHILFGVDDGPETLEESLEMAIKSEKMGINTIVATPHYRHPRYTNERVDAHFAQLEQAARQAGIAVAFKLGNEIYLNEAGVAAALAGDAKPVGGRTLLIELPMSEIYDSHLAMLLQLQLSGFDLIIAHLERYSYLYDNPELMYRLRQSGVQFQVNADSICKLMSRRRALRLIRKGYVDVIASDSHGVNRRVNVMDKAHAIIASSIGAQCAQQLFIEHPNTIVNCEEDPCQIIEAE